MGEMLAGAFRRKGAPFGIAAVILFRPDTYLTEPPLDLWRCGHPHEHRGQAVACATEAIRLLAAEGWWVEVSYRRDGVRVGHFLTRGRETT